MFYRILLSETFARRFDYAFWMESDVQVLQPYWLDKIYEEAMFPSHFWVKGSMYRGDQWDGIPEEHPMQWELMRDYAYHINGVGIYRLGDADFKRFVEAAMRRFPADSMSADFNPFDISIWKVLQEVVSPRHDGQLATTDNWKIFQRYGHCVMYTNFVWNLGGNVQPEVVARARRNRDVYLIHGGTGEFKSRAAALELSKSTQQQQQQQQGVNVHRVRSQGQGKQRREGRERE